MVCFVLTPGKTLAPTTTTMWPTSSVSARCVRGSPKVLFYLGVIALGKMAFMEVTTMFR